MKHCPKCRVESREDADWCWHCGYSYEDATDTSSGSGSDSRQNPEIVPGNSGTPVTK